MEISNVLEGMKVKVSSNIRKSEDKFGSCRRKTQMKDTHQEVRRIVVETKRIYVKNPDNINISFHIDDLKFEVDLPYEKITPITFDPTNLDV